MKTLAENIRTYLKFNHQVLGVSHIYTSTKNEADPALNTDKKKIFNFYLWPENRVWSEYSFENPLRDIRLFQNVFIFFSHDTSVETRLRNQSEMLSKMNQALGGNDHGLLIGWVSANAEREVFEKIAQWTTPLRIVFFRDDVTAVETLYTSGPHKVLETVSPLADPNDQQRKRLVWNDFKRLLALS